MKNKIISIILYVIAIIFFLIYIALEFKPGFNMTEIGRLFLLCSSCIFLYFGGLLLSKYKNNNNPMKINLWIFLTLYIILLITLTLFDSMWGRNGLSISGNIKDYAESMNLVPFKTITNYIKEFNSLYGTKQVLLNLFGNIIAFMPLAFFLPLLIKKQNKIKTFLITTSLIIISIELTQLITSSGRLDIDDYILNMFGVVVMYGIIKIKAVNNLLKNIFLLEKNYISKQNYIAIISAIIVISLSAMGIVKYRNNLYSNNLDDYTNIHNPIIKIIDKTDLCDEAIEPFYEDELFIYYYTCVKSNNVYAVINGKEEYLVKEILSTPDFKYDIGINKIIERFDFYGIDYIKEEKYNKISFSVELDNSKDYYSSPNYEVLIDNESILEVSFDGSYSSLNNYKYDIDLYLIPKLSGTSNIEVIFKDTETNNIIEKYIYSVTVNNDMNTTYELMD